MAESSGVDFIRSAINEHNESGRFNGKIQTRFPPEPNGYLHIGHAKAIVINFGIAEEYGGACNLRFDDTNPEREDVEFVEAIKEDIRWLGYDWEGSELYASDYFDTLYEYAVDLIRKGKAYVDDLTPEQIREYRGTPTEAGRPSPYRERSVEDNLDLFERMRSGEFDEGSRVLRAKIDMSHSNLNMRDPTMYRIRKTRHHRTGDTWFIYPMYDWAHGQSDSIEGVTHSLCSLEFENHRPLYDWFLDELGIHHPQQIEFNRLNLTYTVMSKRRLRELVEEGHVRGWDDPRMPTLSGLRRRGYPPKAIRAFVQQVGVSKTNSMVDLQLLDYFVREELNRSARRVMGVLEPLKLVIENYPEGEVEWFTAENNPEDAAAGRRELPFSREIYIERGDFLEEAPKKWFRLSPGREVRLKHAYYVTCTDVRKDSAGEVVELRCTYDPESRGGDTPDKRKVKGTLHWVSAEHSLAAEVRLYDTLFTRADLSDLTEDEDYRDFLNPDSLLLREARLEPGLANAEVGENLQFMRQGYFVKDPKTADGEKPVFNRTVSLRDSWSKIAQKQAST